jgi:hypothetical protein
MNPVAAVVQGIYFLATGVWPLLSMRTFLAVTGLKTDLWLVKKVGLILAIGAGASKDGDQHHPIRDTIESLVSGEFCDQIDSHPPSPAAEHGIRITTHSKIK